MGRYRKEPASISVSKYRRNMESGTKLSRDVNLVYADGALCNNKRKRQFIPPIQDKPPKNK